MKTETAWAAGFFDGEGCTTLRSYRRNNRDYCYFIVTINQSGSPETLERFRDAVGVGRVTGPYDKQREGRLLTRRFWQYNATGIAAVDAIRKLSPLLSEPKREQAIRNIRRVRPFMFRPGALRQVRAGRAA